MNWRRGLTRVYVVLWALFAVAGIVFAVSETSDVMREREAVADFLKPHGGRVTLEDLQHLSLDSLKARVAERFVMHGGAAQSFPRDATDKEIREFLGLSPSDSLQEVPAYDFEWAQRAGYSAAEIADYLVRERAAGRDLRIAQRLTQEQFSALRDRGMSTEQIANLTLGGVTDVELEGLRAKASTAALARPVVAFGRIWGLWAALCLVVPAAILWTLAWITAGFATRVRAT